MTPIKAGISEVALLESETMVTTTPKRLEGFQLLLIFAHYASISPTIFSGRTISSNSSSVRYFNLSVSSRRVVPFLCASWAISAAL